LVAAGTDTVRASDAFDAESVRSMLRRIGAWLEPHPGTLDDRHICRDASVNFA
jgi:hypothetical protein